MKKALVIVSKELNKKTLKYYSEILLQESIYFVSPNRNSSLDEFKNIVFKNDNFFLNRQDYPILEKTNRPNWYFQQFLKYQIVLSLDYDLIHIVDGDSFVEKELLFNEGVFYSRKIVENEYYDFISLLFNKKKNYSKRNYITNQMCFKKTYLTKMIKNLNNLDDNWINQISKLLLENSNLWFSEYQTYADFVLNNYDTNEKLIKVFRRFDLIDDTLENAFNKYNVLAEERYHKISFIRSVRAKLFYLLNLNLG